MRSELKSLIDRLGHDLGHIIGVRKLWKMVAKGKRPSVETLDRLALLAGFQTWDDLHEALLGRGGDSLNYDDGPTEDGKKTSGKR